MKKHLIVVIIVTLLFCIFLTGCNEDSNKKDDINKFIGTWEGTSIFLNETTDVTLTFNEDNTLKQVSEEDHIHWFNYRFDNNLLYMEFPELPEGFAISYIYEFSNNNTALTLTNESFDTLVLNKILNY